jgi:arylsulfatase A-like enzyme
MGQNPKESLNRSSCGVGRREFLQTLAVSALALSVPKITLGAEDKRPNLIIIVADDLGYCDTNLYGCDRHLTPNLKALAASGVLFTDGHVTAAVCSPSRAGLITGRYQQRFGHEFNTGPMRRDLTQGLGLPITEVTLADTLKKAGYATGMVGKSHLGMQPQFFPLKRGFDEYFGFTFGGNMYINPQDPNALSLGGQWGMNKTITSRGQENPIYRMAQPVEELEHLTDAFSREAVNFIGRHKGHPFFLYLTYNAPHTPYQTTKKYYDRFPHIKDEAKRIYAAMINQMDEGIGTVINKLKAEGIDKNTLVFFISDNGCATYTEACDNLPLRYGKISYFEGGIRVPFVASCPGLLPAGLVYREPVSSLDIFPTAVNLAKGEMPGPKRDGVDLIPFLQGKKGSPHEYLFWRSGDALAVRNNEWKLFRYLDQYRLYDLNQDLGEQKDQVAAQSAIFKRLKEALAGWESELIPPRWSPASVVDVEQDGIKMKLKV